MYIIRVGAMFYGRGWHRNVFCLTTKSLDIIRFPSQQEAEKVADVLRNSVEWENAVNNRAVVVEPLLSGKGETTNG